MAELRPVEHGPTPRPGRAARRLKGGEALARHGVLRLSVADGLAGEVGVLHRMRGPVFEKACTAAGFAAVTVDAETGTVVFPGGADLAPDTLYERGQHRPVARPACGR